MPRLQRPHRHGRVRRVALGIGGGQDAVRQQEQAVSSVERHIDRQNFVTVS